MLTNKIELIFKAGKASFSYEEVEDLVQQYRSVIKGKPYAGKSSSLVGTPEAMLDKIIEYGIRINVGVKMMKIVLGMIFSTVKSTTDNQTFAEIIDKRFGITVQTANRYALIYDAIYSNEFLYSLSSDYNPLDLSMRDMEMLAELIVTGELSEDRAHMLFSEGDWLTKRDIIRDEVPKIVQRNGKRSRRANRTRRKFRPSPGGDLYYSEGIRFGILFLEDTNPQIRAIAKRALDAIKKEIMDREEIK